MNLLAPLLTTGEQKLQQPLFKATPGTVSPYDHHIFIRAASEPAQNCYDNELTSGPSSWPAVVERQPGVSQVFATLAQSREQTEGVVRVTAFEPLESEPLEADCCDMFIFPAGVRHSRLKLSSLAEHVQRYTSKDAPENSILAKMNCPQDDVTNMLNIFVCCHGARDARCGIVGPPLCTKLQRSIRMRSLQGRMHVFMCSHIGGHKCAGNVLVYGAVSPSDGDCFGGLNANNAEDFLDALLDLQVDADGGPADPILRQWWRGRMGLSKAEQLQFFEDKHLPHSEEYDSADDSVSQAK
ncbi:hypothetical protein WJX73_006819 [Symbiochloris irregularis]|uniref:Uncharacterized protein n=1 Tax=Symbiochloris irregularis TaxID=706552 RepID=A0AAW1PLP7_9CHLO